jgi:hypothetical protein
MSEACGSEQRIFAAEAEGKVSMARCWIKNASFLRSTRKNPANSYSSRSLEDYQAYLDMEFENDGSDENAAAGPNAGTRRLVLERSVSADSSNTKGSGHRYELQDAHMDTSAGFFPKYTTASWVMQRMRSLVASKHRTSNNIASGDSRMHCQDASSIDMF